MVACKALVSDVCGKDHSNVGMGVVTGEARRRDIRAHAADACCDRRRTHVSGQTNLSLTRPLKGTEKLLKIVGTPFAFFTLVFLKLLTSGLVPRQGSHVLLPEYIHIYIIYIYMLRPIHRCVSGYILDCHIDNVGRVA